MDFLYCAFYKENIFYRDMNGINKENIEMSLFRNLTALEFL